MEIRSVIGYTSWKIEGVQPFTFYIQKFNAITKVLKVLSQSTARQPTHQQEKNRNNREAGREDSDIDNSISVILMRVDAKMENMDIGAERHGN
nr:hypothetical protein [Tanacetum cinerariifolium]